jgi:hypothetical protein
MIRAARIANFRGDAWDAWEKRRFNAEIAEIAEKKIWKNKNSI